jgi:hypothetical protein
MVKRNLFKVLFLLIFLWFTSLDLKSQIVNVENKRLYDDTLGWAGSLSADFSFVQNRERLTSYKVLPHLQWRNHDNCILFFGSSEFTQGNQTKYLDAHLAHLRYWHRIAGPFKWEAFTQAQYNPLLNLELRALVGTGFRFKLYEKDKTKMYLGSSYMLEHENLQPDDVKNWNHRWSSYFSWFLEPNKNFYFTGAAYYQPRFDSFKDFRFSIQSSVVSKISKRIEMQFTFNQMFDSQPPQDLRKHIFSTGCGFRFRLGKI